MFDKTQNYIWELWKFPQSKTAKKKIKVFGKK